MTNNTKGHDNQGQTKSGNTGSGSQLNQNKQGGASANRGLKSSDEELQRKVSGSDSKPARRNDDMDMNTGSGKTTEKNKNHR